MEKRRILPALVGVVMMSASGCNPAPTSEPRSFDIDAATAAYVNGQPIYVIDVELEAVAQGLAEAGAPFTAEHPDFQLVLDQIIDQALLAQEATARGLHLDANARRRLESARERVLGNILVESLVAREVTEDSIRRMYDEQAALQQIDDEVNLRHILLANEEDAETAYQRILDGEDFTTVAFEMSIDTRSRIEGGALGYVEPNRMGEPFSSEIANTPTDEISEPFQSEQGWHILKIEDRRTPPPATLEEMRPEIVTFLTFTEISKILTDLRATASIDPGDTAPSGESSETETEPAAGAGDRSGQ
ncbi:MAG: peptidylprolyl isomerase [Pseudomonadota bacterium]